MSNKFLTLAEELRGIENDPEFGAWTPRATDLRDKAQDLCREHSDTIIEALELAGKYEVVMRLQGKFLGNREWTELPAQPKEEGK